MVWRRSKSGAALRHAVLGIRACIDAIREGGLFTAHAYCLRCINVRNASSLIPINNCQNINIIHQPAKPHIYGKYGKSNAFGIAALKRISVIVLSRAFRRQTVSTVLRKNEGPYSGNYQRLQQEGRFRKSDVH